MQQPFQFRRRRIGRAFLILAGLGLATLSATAQEQKQPPKQEPPARVPGAALPNVPGLLPGGMINPGGLAGLQQAQLRQMQQLAEQIRQLNELNRQLQPGVVPVPANPAPRGANAAPRTARGDGRLGVQLEQPGDAVVDQLDLPKGVGLIVNEVLANSAAEKAGLKANDILLELDGKPVASDLREFVKDLNGVPADRAVEAVVLRGGKRETLQGLSLPEARAQAPANPPRRGANDPDARAQALQRLQRLQLILPGLGGLPNRRLPAAPLPLPLP
jgi:hypothetical protein